MILTHADILRLKSEGKCISCETPYKQNCYSPAGLREWEISGLCEKCFDELFAEEDDNESL